MYHIIAETARSVKECKSVKNRLNVYQDAEKTSFVVVDKRGFFDGAGNRGRTCTPMAQEPKSCMSANSIIPADIQIFKKPIAFAIGFLWSGLRGSNSLPPPWQGGALPDELKPHQQRYVFYHKLLTCQEEI